MNSMSNPNVKQYNDIKSLDTEAFQNQLTCELKEVKNKNQIRFENAKCNLTITCIDNAHWLIPLILVLVVAFIIDVCMCCFYWKRPSILFEQMMKTLSYVPAFIFGLVTDYIKRKITKVK